MSRRLGPMTAGLAHRERREVVVVEVVLLALQRRGVQPHLLLERAQRRRAERLGLAAGEQRRAVRPGGHAHLDRDVTDLVLRAPVGPALVDRDALADDRLLERVEHELGRGETRLGLLELLLPRTLACGRRVLGQDRLLDRLAGGLALELVLDLGRVVQRLAMGLANTPRAAPRRGPARATASFSLPTRSASSRCRAQSLRISAWAMSSASSISASEISLAPGLDHQNGLLRARDDEIELGGRPLGEVGSSSRSGSPG